jgi:hypothetical protein
MGTRLTPADQALELMPDTMRAYGQLTTDPALDGFSSQPKSSRMFECSDVSPK